MKSTQKERKRRTISRFSPEEISSAELRSLREPPRFRLFSAPKPPPMRRPITLMSKSSLFGQKRR